jgi:murein DD-endopeptidase MepM/ murein hydrolase activator NlpD
MAAVIAAVVLATAAALLRARRHHWGTAVELTRFPLDGHWYVVQGGGRGLNHHFGLADQRGAVDLVRPGAAPWRRRRTLAAYPAYGATVYAPCAGVVVAAVDGIEDQPPGALRYAPLYGNHVFLETEDGAVVKLAHLRPGSVRVAVGRRVSPGDVLGEVGNSGNSSEPHLHLHAERAGLGLDLRFSGLPGRLHRGRTLRVPPTRRT